MVGKPVDTSSGNVVNYNPGGSATIGSLLAINTQTGDFHLITPGVDSNGQYESLVDHVSGTNQIRESGGYVFASYNTLAHRTFSGDYIRVTLGALSPESHEITVVTAHRSGAYNNTTGESCPECQYIPNSSADGSKLLITSTFGVDVSAIDPLASNALSATKTFLVDFALQGGPVTNNRPTLLSSNAYEVAEGTVWIATFSGEDKDIHDFGSLVYSLTGADSDFFSIGRTTGALQFANAPEFGSPHDTNQDNVYEVNVTVTDRVGESFTQHVSVRVQDADARYSVTQLGATLRMTTSRSNFKALASRIFYFWASSMMGSTTTNLE